MGKKKKREKKKGGGDGGGGARCSSFVCSHKMIWISIALSRSGELKTRYKSNLLIPAKIP